MNIFSEPVNTDWHQHHREVIEDFLAYLNAKSDRYILKGGTALLMCYGLDRFSEDIDLDGQGNRIANVVDSFCKERGYTYSIAKDTKTVKRYKLHYGSDKKSLKIEISYRDSGRYADYTTKINGILVYHIDMLCNMKIGAYSGREKIRDLYDIAFIYNHFSDQISGFTEVQLLESLSRKDLSYAEYLLRTQSDELIDNNKLLDDVLHMYEKLDLM